MSKDEINEIKEREANFPGLKKYYLFGFLRMMGYLAFMLFSNLPLYYHQWREDVSNGKTYDSFEVGLRHAMDCPVKSKSWKYWKSEARWQAPYFTLMVRYSLILANHAWTMRPKYCNFTALQTSNDIVKVKGE